MVYKPRKRLHEIYVKMQTKKIQLHLNCEQFSLWMKSASSTETSGS